MHLSKKSDPVKTFDSFSLEEKNEETWEEIFHAPNFFVQVIFLWKIIRDKKKRFAFGDVNLNIKDYLPKWTS